MCGRRFGDPPTLSDLLYLSTEHRGPGQYDGAAGRQGDADRFADARSRHRTAVFFRVVTSGCHTGASDIRGARATKCESFRSRLGIEGWEKAISIRLVVADDHALVLDALAETLHSVPGFEVVGRVDDSAQIISTALRVLPTVAVLSMGLTGCDCLALAKELRRTVPTCRIAFIAARPTRALVDRAVEAGALSVIPRHARLFQLVGAIRGVAAGCLTIDECLIDGRHSSSQSLSIREREILSLTASGAPMKEIAKELFLSVGTVRNLSSTAIRKLNGRNRFDAARIAYERGWL
jgi:two-component system response regulator DesR